MDPARRYHPPRARRSRRRQGRRRLGLIVAGGLIAGSACSAISANNDGIATLEITFPANLFVEESTSVKLSAVARNAAGDSVPAEIRWRTPDSTITLDSLTGLATAMKRTGTARIQVGVFGQDTILTTLAGLTLTLTARADSLVLTSEDSVTITRDSLDTQQIRVSLQGGSPLAGVAGRPIILRIVEPVPADSPAVTFQSGRTLDSLMTGGTGAVTSTVKGIGGRPRPDRAVVEINAYRATGVKIPGSGRRVVVRFLHQ